MDRETMEAVKGTVQNYGSTGVAALVAMFGLGDLPWELIGKWHDWYMQASREELVKESVFILAMVICFLYKRPQKVKTNEEVIVLTDRVNP